jgi:O-succinylhomoserine sulfhydrylase
MAESSGSRKPETDAIRIRTESSAHREHASAVYLTSSFTFESAEHARALFAGDETGYVYSRYGNPNIEEFVQKMCRLEEAEDGVAFASGMAAIFSTLAGLLTHGDHVVASRSLFGSTHQILTRILPDWGIETSYGDLPDLESWEGLFTESTKICLVETPSNPALDLVDLNFLSSMCQARGVVLLVDNVFATPVLQKPIRFGADLVMHSATKYIDGQGRGLGGVVVGRSDLIEKLQFFSRHTGPALSPFNAWMFSRSLETLSLRVRKHAENAATLAAFLQDEPAIAAVRYPFLPSHPQFELAQRQMELGGGIVSFELHGGLDQGRRFLDALRMCSLTSNLGDTRTIATHPASTTHNSLSEEERQAVGITPGFIRISVGLEHIEDIKADVSQALAASSGDQ